MNRLMNSRGILSHSKEEVYTWIEEMISSTVQATIKAEEIAFGGVPPDKTVSDVISMFKEQRSIVYFQIHLTTLAIKRFEKEAATAWENGPTRLDDCYKRCAIASDLLETARAASA